ncbi:MAG: cell division protein FtsH, partial [Spirochaetales bacterium]|nr:cell division protein FtsH [Spirochaetales bacterium]
AYHEAGHALLHYHLENTDPLHKVTIIPRGRALGMALSLPEKESYSKDKSWLLDRIKITMGGYVAEELIYGETTTGTQNDIQQATNIARRMVTEWGMSDSFNFISFGQEEEPIFIGKEIARHKDYSEQTAMRIDEEISKILESSLEETRKILNDNLDQLKLIARELINKETLDDHDIKVLIGIEVE